MPLALNHTFRALRHRNYRLFFTGQGLSLIGTWLQQVAMGWLTYRLTGSAWLLGVVAFCANVGILLFSNVSGVLADRIDRRRGLLVTQSLMLVQMPLARSSRCKPQSLSSISGTWILSRPKTESLALLMQFPTRLSKVLGM